MGAAVAYQLALFGWGTDTMVLEQSVIAGGSKWHSSGIVGTFKPTLTQVKLAQSSVELIKSLEEAGKRTTGSLADQVFIVIRFRILNRLETMWWLKCGQDPRPDDLSAQDEVDEQVCETVTQFPSLPHPICICRASPTDDDYCDCSLSRSLY